MAYRHSGYRSGSGSRHPESHEPKAENVSQYVVRRISAPPAQRPAPPAPRPQRQLIDVSPLARYSYYFGLMLSDSSDRPSTIEGRESPTRFIVHGWETVSLV